MAIKHRQNEIARIYVWILESGSIQGKTHKVAPVITFASSYGTVVNMIKGTRGKATSSEAADERSKQRFTADWCQMHQLGGCMLARQEHTKFADRAARSSEREEC